MGNAEDSLLLVLDYEKVCRLCLNTTVLMADIFSFEAEVPLQHQIEVLLKIPISKFDSLPTKICYHCLHKVEEYWLLYSTMRQTQQLLLGSLQDDDLNDIKVTVTECEPDDAAKHISQQPRSSSEKSLQRIDVEMKAESLSENYCEIDPVKEAVYSSDEQIERSSRSRQRVQAPEPAFRQSADGESGVGSGQARQYVRKRNGGRERKRRYGTIDNYSAAHLARALDALRRREMDSRSVAALYGIPRSTLLYKLRDQHAQRVGRPYSLTRAEELQCARHLLALHDRAVPVAAHDLRLAVAAHLRDAHRTTAFRDNLPGYDWIRSFLTRHPDLKDAFDLNIARKRRKLDKEVLEEFFVSVREAVDDVGGAGPGTLYVLEEAALECGGRCAGRCGARRGVRRRRARHPSAPATASPHTALLACNALGQILPPMYIFESTEGGCELKQDRYAYSASGWLTEEVFEAWVSRRLVPALGERARSPAGAGAGAVLLCDGLSAHVSAATLRLLGDHRVSLVCFPPGSSHILNPFEMVYREKLRGNWKVAVESDVVAEGLSEEQFEALVVRALSEEGAGLARVVRTGFAACGLHPLRPELPLRALAGLAYHGDTSAPPVPSPAHLRAALDESKTQLQCQAN